jgi:hypothetical protein
MINVAPISRLLLGEPSRCPNRLVQMIAGVRPGAIRHRGLRTEKGQKHGVVFVDVSETLNSSQGFLADIQDVEGLHTNLPRGRGRAGAFPL